MKKNVDSGIGTQENSILNESRLSDITKIENPQTIGMKILDMFKMPNMFSSSSSS
jgi:hypothetical protein